jgi:hypothetical protein
MQRDKDLHRQGQTTSGSSVLSGKLRGQRQDSKYARGATMPQNRAASA